MWLSGNHLFRTYDDIFRVELSFCLVFSLKERQREFEREIDVAWKRDRDILKERERGREIDRETDVV